MVHAGAIESEMDRSRFDEIIEFAIEREKEAVEFYKDLQRKTALSEKMDFLKNLEKMELGHIRTLELIKAKDIKEIEIQETIDLRISDFIVSTDAALDEMSYQDILITAMKKEEASFRLYSSLESSQNDAGAKKLFKKLASEEAGHKLLFEKLYDDEILSQA